MAKGTEIVSLGWRTPTNIDSRLRTERLPSSLCPFFCSWLTKKGAKADSGVCILLPGPHETREECSLPLPLPQLQTFTWCSFWLWVLSPRTENRTRAWPQRSFLPPGGARAVRAQGGVWRPALSLGGLSVVLFACVNSWSEKKDLWIL